MCDFGLYGKMCCKFVKIIDSKYVLFVVFNLLDRNFIFEVLNIVWVSDIIYILIKEGWLYLVVMMDLFVRMIVGWLMENIMMV